VDLIQTEVFSKVNPPYFEIVSEDSWSSGTEDGAVIDNISAVRDLQGFSDIVIGNQHPNILRFQMRNDLLNFNNRYRIDARKRLVQAE
jgi:hypothetical protein